MKSSSTRAPGAILAGIAALLVLAGCASSPRPVNWNTASAREQHLYFPGTVGGTHPLVVVTSGANGLVVGGGPVAATDMVAQDGQVMLVTSDRATALRANQTQALGAGQVLPAPADPAMPRK